MPARLFAAFLPAIRSSSPLAVATIVLGACSLQTAIPGYEPQISDRALASDWPELAEQSAFADGIAPPDDIENADQIAARAEALRLRAEALNRPVVTSSEIQ